ncbi:hypothetical protein KCG44_02340 [Pacificimonas sp. WHA3]|uniref:Uncharacterized protein n=1 Tax=Pacificimonas pallii TaxID=2827236 RepID=A0ABS6SB29_9SPHN|nr:hypothetical protein [Pacificimonas pallii]MBV7255620.1 hypothetical protein [Pacificimonas pallii]
MKPLVNLAFIALFLLLWAGWRYSLADRQVEEIMLAIGSGAAIPDVPGTEDIPPPAPAMPVPAPTEDAQPLVVAEAQFPRRPASTRAAPSLRRPQTFTPGIADDPGRGAVAAGPASARRLPAPPPLAPAAAPPFAKTTAQRAPGAERPVDIAARELAKKRQAAFDLAALAYERLDGLDRRGAAENFAAALRAQPDHESAGIWQDELRLLTRRWTAEAYIFEREGVSANLSPTVPVFGGRQYGASLAYTLNPLADAPVAINGRLTGTTGGGPDEAVAGIGWRPFGRRGPEVAVERRFELREPGRSAMQLRLSGGANSDQRSSFDLSAYADAGIVGMNSADLFAGGQAFVGRRWGDVDEPRVSIGAGAWGGVQHDGDTVSLLEAGPAARAEIPIGDVVLDLRGSYRFEVGGNARSGGGPTVTVAIRY